MFGAALDTYRSMPDAFGLASIVETLKHNGDYERIGGLSAITTIAAGYADMDDLDYCIDTIKPTSSARSCRYTIGMAHVYIICRACGWVHIYDRDNPGARWSCWHCGTADAERLQFVSDAEADEACPRGVTIQPINR